MKKHEAYSWLSERLGIERDYTHIGMFDVDLCEKVIEVCQDYMFQCEMEGILHKSQQQRPLGLTHQYRCVFTLNFIHHIRSNCRRYYRFSIRV